MRERAEDRIKRFGDWLAGPRGRRWSLRLLIVVAVVGFFSWIRRPGDFAGYLLVGELALAGGHIYQDAPPGISTWPPFFSLVCVPLALIARPSVYLARGFWILLNYALLLIVLRQLARLVYDRGLTLRSQGAGLSLAAPAILVPLLLTSRFVFANFEHLQMHILLFALTLGGLQLQAARREVVGGVAIGCASALKVMPVVFLPYLIYRKRWRAAASMTVTAVALGLSPVIAYGRERFSDYLVAWRDAVAAGWGVGKMNQSVFAMFDRLLGHGMVPFTVRGINQVPASGQPLVSVAVVALAAAVALASLCLFRGELERGSWPELAEWSVVFIVSAMFGPVSWKAYLIVYLLPTMLLFAAWRSDSLPRRTRETAAWALLAYFVLGTLTTDGLVGRTLSGVFEMASLVTLAGLVLLAGSLWLRDVLRSPAGRAATVGGAR